MSKLFPKKKHFYKNNKLTGMFNTVIIPTKSLWIK